MVEALIIRPIWTPHPALTSRFVDTPLRQIGMPRSHIFAIFRSDI
jgi:hypothetical protein